MCIDYVYYDTLLSKKTLNKMYNISAKINIPLMSELDL